METDLSLVPMDVIFEELGKRYDNFVFCGMAVRRENEDGTGNIYNERFYHGNNAACLGLMEQMKFFLCHKHFFDSEEVLDDDNETSE
jgi:hypothetical protein